MFPVFELDTSIVISINYQHLFQVLHVFLFHLSFYLEQYASLTTYQSSTITVPERSDTFTACSLVLSQCIVVMRPQVSPAQKSEISYFNFPQYSFNLCKCRSKLNRLHSPTTPHNDHNAKTCGSADKSFID